MSKSTKSIEVYIPMSARVLTPGHIKVIAWLSERFKHVIVGLLTKAALRGYKDEVVPFRDRMFILRTIAKAFPNVSVVAQYYLDPSDGCYLYSVGALASGDGFEPVELDAIKRYNLLQIDVKLPGEISKEYSSTKILERNK